MIGSSNTSLVSLKFHVTSSITNEQVNESGRSKRQRIESSFGQDFVTSFLVDNNAFLVEKNDVN